MTEQYFVLEGTRVRAVDFMEWAFWMEANRSKRIIQQEWIGGCLVSTVFLGINHNFLDGPPLLFETMIFHGKHDGYTARCTNWFEAHHEHAKAKLLVLQTSSTFALVFGDLARWRNLLLQRMRLRWALLQGRHFAHSNWNAQMRSFVRRLRACLSEWRR